MSHVKTVCHFHCLVFQPPIERMRCDEPEMTKRVGIGCGHHQVCPDSAQFSRRHESQAAWPNYWLQQLKTGAAVENVGVLLFEGLLLLLLLLLLLMLMLLLHLLCSGCFYLVHRWILGIMLRYHLHSTILHDRQHMKLICLPGRKHNSKPFKN